MTAISKDRLRLVCLGDSVTRGARLEDPETSSYPARLQALLGTTCQVINLGVGSCTMIRAGKPNVWSRLDAVRQAQPNGAIIILGTNDTCSGTRKCWDHKGEFGRDYRDFIDELRRLPSRPLVWICAPTPMVLATPGLTPERTADLSERAPRLEELITLIRKVAVEKQVGYIDLYTPLRNRPALFTHADGVHPNPDGYLAVARLVYAHLKTATPPH